MIGAWLTDATKTGSVRRLEGVLLVGGAMRAATAVLLGMGLFSLSCGDSAKAEPTGAEIRLAQAVYPDAPPPRRRPRLRVYPQAEPDGVYPRYNPGPDAVRQCNATYVQEFRPSGTVIVPHMSCYWRRG
jgi:hypothetical protein